MTKLNESDKPAFELGIPASAMSFDCELQFGDNGEDAKSSPVKMLARTFAFNHPWWGKVEHDFDGMTHKSRIPLDYCHDSKELVGYANKFEVDSKGLTLSGAITPYKDDRASEIVHKAKLGVPYQSSIDFRGPVSIEEVGEGLTAEVNGHTFTGPGTIVRKWQLRGCAVCPHGADSNSTSMFAADSATYAVEVIPKPEPKTENIMSEDIKAETLPVVDAKVLAEAPPAVEAVAPAAAETLSAPVVTPVVEVAPKPETAAEVAKKYLDAYGANGLQWLAEGKSFEECQALFVAKLQADNLDLSKRLEAVQLGEAPLKPSLPASDNPSPNKQAIPEHLSGGERAIFTQLRMP